MLRVAKLHATQWREPKRMGATAVAYRVVQTGADSYALTDDTGGAAGGSIHATVDGVEVRTDDMTGTSRMVRLGAGAFAIIL